jgi:hypothetical protein
VQKSKAAKLLAAQSSSKSKGKKKKWSKGKLREKKVRHPTASDSNRSGLSSSNRQRPQQGLQAAGGFLSGLADTAAERITVLHADRGVGADRERIAAWCGLRSLRRSFARSVDTAASLHFAARIAAARLRSSSPWR